MISFSFGRTCLTYQTSILLASAFRMDGLKPGYAEGLGTHELKLVADRD